jgi:hypothetical protein
MAAVINAQRDASKPAIQPKQLHPYYTKASGGLAITRETMQDVVALFVSPERARATEERVQREKAITERLIAEQMRRLHGHPSVQTDKVLL